MPAGATMTAAGAINAPEGWTVTVMPIIRTVMRIMCIIAKHAGKKETAAAVPELFPGTQAVEGKMNISAERSRVRSRFQSLHTEGVIM